MLKVIWSFTITFVLIQTSTLASERGQLYLAGIVHHSVKVDIVQPTQASDLQLSSDGEAVVIASISESTNSQAPYEVTIDSKNNGHLISSTYGEDIPYSIKILQRNNKKFLMLSTPGNEIDSRDHSDDIYYTITTK